MFRTHRFINKLLKSNVITNSRYIFNNTSRNFNCCLLCDTIQYCKSNSKCKNYNYVILTDDISAIISEIIGHRNNSRNNSGNNSIYSKDNSDDDYEDNSDD